MQQPPACRNVTEAHRTGGGGSQQALVSRAVLSETMSREVSDRVNIKHAFWTVLYRTGFP